MTQPEMFARTLQQTNIWLNDICEQMQDRNENAAYASMRAVLHQLRDRLTVEEAAHLSAQLPTLMRGIFYEGYRPAEMPQKIRSAEEFMAGVRDRLNGHPDIDPEVATMAVLAVLDRHIGGSGELKDVRGMLPKEIQSLFPAGGGSGSGRA